VEGLTVGEFLPIKWKYFKGNYLNSCLFIRRFMKDNMEFYYINTDYINYLKTFQDHIYDNDDKSFKRPYIGVVFKIDDFNYYAPLSSPKPKHKYWKDGLDFLRVENQEKLKAVINLNNIIPVHDSLIDLVDMNSIKNTDMDYYNLLLEEMIIIRKKQNIICKNSRIIYNIVTKNRSGSENLIKRCYDFKLLEEKCKEFILLNNK